MNSIVSVQGLMNEVCEKLKGVKESSRSRERKFQKHLQQLQLDVSVRKLSFFPKRCSTLLVRVVVVALTKFPIEFKKNSY